LEDLWVPSLTWSNLQKKSQLNKKPCLDVGNPTAKIEYFPSGT